MVQCQQTDIPKDDQYVLDGGDLLHKYHGLKVQPTQKYQNHTETMSSASMGKPL